MKKERIDENGMPILPGFSVPADPFGGIMTDPLGSYTGKLMDWLEEPVQDADDL